MTVNISLGGNFVHVMGYQKGSENSETIIDGVCSPHFSLILFKAVFALGCKIEKLRCVFCQSVHGSKPIPLEILKKHLLYLEF